MGCFRPLTLLSVRRSSIRALRENENAVSDHAGRFSGAQCALPACSVVRKSQRPENGQGHSFKNDARSQEKQTTHDRDETKQLTERLSDDQGWRPVQRMAAANRWLPLPEARTAASSLRADHAANDPRYTPDATAEITGLSARRVVNGSATHPCDIQPFYAVWNAFKVDTTPCAPLFARVWAPAQSCERSERSLSGRRYTRAAHPNATPPPSKASRPDIGCCSIRERSRGGGVAIVVGCPRMLCPRSRLTAARRSTNAH
jgi:hypothetical protein